ncbi:MAG: hypothetical protein KatS3mg038_2966 [Candidatus Kapaibacterium sp.]|nr:MAG: hypothetical protein KatS3mg038_2966 [Candidatus Kapabacteria bacterium]
MRTVVAVCLALVFRSARGPPSRVCSSRRVGIICCSSTLTGRRASCRRT